MDAEIIPFVEDWEEHGELPEHLAASAYRAGVYGAGFPKEFGGTGPEPFDIFHAVIMNDELGRACAGGLNASLFTHGIGLPPLLNVGSPAQQRRWAPDIIAGKKKICLAITEPTGGSDVANIRTTAVRNADDSAYLVSGNKTFISGGMNADYFTTAVRTDPDSMGITGISLLLIEKDSPGLKLTRIKTQGWHCSTTTSIAFDSVPVPVEHLLGTEGAGFMAIMLNFNNERLAMAVTANRMARCCLEDAVAYATSRHTFGKPLAKHQVIRHKLMECARMIMATHALVSNLCQQKHCGIDDLALAGAFALAKVQATKTMEFVARETFQVFGGRAYVRGGKGGNVERVYREVRVYAIGGGSEEIMLDLASRQARL